MTTLRTHNVTLQGKKVVLRPLTEADWDTLMQWNSDPEVLYYAEGDDVSAYSLEDVQAIYRSISQAAFCFLVVADGQAVGDTWLQQMNLSRITDKYPEDDCHRIDLELAKPHWQHGFGTEIIQLLTDFAFQVEGADRVFGCDIADYNPGSLRVFQKAGYTIEAKIAQPPGNKAAYRYDVMCLRK